MDNKSQTYTTSSVTSSDGTIIGYRQLGSGPGIILLHGGASASQGYMKLGTLLSDTFTVYIPDRRGRGLSGPFGDNYDIKKTDAHIVFGLSTGALIALQAALNFPSIHKAALDELPLDIDNSTMAILAFMPRFDQEIAEGKVAEASVTLTNDFGKFFLPGSIQFLIAILPRFVLVRFYTWFMRNDAKNILSLIHISEPTRLGMISYAVFCL